jgi:hypothetical protein
MIGMSEIIRAEIIGTNIAIACDITSNGRTPILRLCRALLKAGHNPASPLHCYRGMVLALTITSIGEGARLTVRETEKEPPTFRLLDTNALARMREAPGLSPPQGADEIPEEVS